MLARNEDLLPLDAGALRSVAVLGALADDARIQGGGSARVLPRHIISPLAGLTAALPGTEVVYAVGADPRPELAAATGLEWTPITTTLRDAGGNALYESSIDAADVRWMGELPDGVDPASAATVEIAATFTPSVTGTHQLAANGFGNLALRVGGETLFEQLVYAPGDDPVTTAFLTPVETRFPVEAVAGKPVEVVLTHQIYPGRHGFVTLTLGHGRRSPTTRRCWPRRPGSRPGPTSRSWSSAPPRRSSPRASTARRWRCRAARTSWWPGSRRPTRARWSWSTRARRC